MTSDGSVLFLHPPTATTAAIPMHFNALLPGMRR